MLRSRRLGLAQNPSSQGPSHFSDGLLEPGSGGSLLSSRRQQLQLSAENMRYPRGTAARPKVPDASTLTQFVFPNHGYLSHRRSYRSVRYGICQ